MPIPSLNTSIMILLFSWISAIAVHVLLFLFMTKHRWKHRSYFLAAVAVGLPGVYVLVALTYNNPKDNLYGWIVILLLVNAWATYRLVRLGFLYLLYWQDSRRHAGLPC